MSEAGRFRLASWREMPNTVHHPFPFIFLLMKAKKIYFIQNVLDRTCSYIFEEEDVVVVDVGVDNGA